MIIPVDRGNRYPKGSELSRRTCLLHDTPGPVIGKSIS
jgi:hypothetical protein